MTRVRIGALFTLTVVACALPFGTAQAEDTKGKWQLGFGLSYYSTVDYIRSNSDIAIAAQTTAEAGTLPGVGSVDVRPDENMLNQPSIHDNFKLDFSASYGLTRWLAMELQTGYMKSNVGNIEYFTDIGVNAYGSDSADLAHNLCGPTLNQTCYTYNLNLSGSNKHNDFVPVGQLTEIPIMLSALVRFRPESPLDPYIGLGAGYVIANLQTGDEFNARSADTAALRITVASEGEWTDASRADKTAAAPGFAPAPLEATVNSGFEYHIVGGVDYYINEHMSFYVDARYVWSNTAVNITIDNVHQALMSNFLPGKLQVLSVGSATSPIPWEDSGIKINNVQVCPDCVGDGLLATEDGNGNGTVDPSKGEGNGTLYFFPAGPDPNALPSTLAYHDPSEAVKVEQCAACATDGAFDTEDRNDNGIMDRYLLYGVDVCSLPVPPGSAPNPVCRPEDFRPSVQYVWPTGCSTSVQARSPGSILPEGCPPSPNVGLTNAGVDDIRNVYLIQGGQIHLGAFSLGVGFKFTF